MILKLKSILYRYTGIYLAQKEEQDYVASLETKKYAKELSDNPENELDMYESINICIGLWQANNNFVRPFSLVRYRKPRFFWNIVGWFHVLYLRLKWDIYALFGR